ncbi:MAG: CHAD domain-containing protein [Planctomycetes bacterium]|nr:CHAD domain-containing protein [Planctomycetota bacterium]
MTASIRIRRKQIWRVAPGAPLAGELRRVVREEIDRLAGVAKDANTALAVHRIRQSLKRLRALNRLLRGAAGEKYYKSLNVKLRNLGRALGGARDAGVLLRIFQQLSGAGDRSPALRKLLERRARAEEKAAERSVDSIALEMLVIQKEWTRRLAGDGAAIAPARAVRNAMKRARKQYKTAAASLAPGELHELRKRVKIARSQMELLVNIVKPPSAAAVGLWLRTMERLSDALGDCHDIRVFVDSLARIGGADFPPRLLAAARRREKQLIRQSLKLAGEALAFDAAATLQLGE